MLGQYDIPSFVRSLSTLCFLQSLPSAPQKKNSSPETPPLPLTLKQFRSAPVFVKSRR
jgi:hypothetical protein